MQAVFNYTSFTLIIWPKIKPAVVLINPDLQHSNPKDTDLKGQQGCQGRIFSQTQILGKKKFIPEKNYALPI